MKHPAVLLSCAAMSLVSGAPAIAQAAPKAATIEANFANHSAHFIDADRFDPRLVLPPPPAQGSEQTRRELKELHEIQTTRTREALARALADDRDESIFIFADVLGPKFNAAALPATAEFGKMIRNDAEIIAGRSKAWFARPRPYAVDPSIVGCPYRASKPVLTSYPSGHAANGFSYGFVLAALMPEHSTEILRRARDYADQRLVCGHHYRSDVDASAILASEFARDASSNPEFVRRLNAVRAELRSAGFLK